MLFSQEFRSYTLLLKQKSTTKRRRKHLRHLPLLLVKKQNGKVMVPQAEGTDCGSEQCMVYKEVDKMVEFGDKQPWVSTVDSWW